MDNNEGFNILETACAGALTGACIASVFSFHPMFLMLIPPALYLSYRSVTR